MSDHEMQFGEIQQSQRSRRLRPDANKQLAIVACGSPQPRDLPVFVDLDVMREMEIHAQSDRSVELGGVMLGGQFEDDSGQSYVVVQDSLRARHYENSKGSFKFTHDTWSDITRRREEFPDDLEMVGWYHTHPDWGVFLSSMDMFICDHFFNLPLDVALVIDPCRDERGWFQWSDDPGARVRQVGGFYLFASRHRQVELEMYAAQLEGKPTMSYDPRSGGPAFPGAAYPVTITNTPDPRSAWLAVGVMGMLTMQFLVLVLIAWKLMFGSPDAVAPGAASQSQPVAESADRELERRWQAQRVEAQLQLLDRVVEVMDEDAPKNLVLQLEHQRRENEQLTKDVEAYRALESKLHADTETLQRKLDEAERLEAGLRSQVRTLDGALAESKQRESGLEERIDELEDQLGTAGEGESAEKDGRAPSWSAPWWVWAGGAALIVIVGGVGYALATLPREQRVEFGENEDDSAGAESPSSDASPENPRDQGQS